MITGQCSCREIQAADETRHFRGCVMREVYPDHAAAHDEAVAAEREACAQIAADYARTVSQALGQNCITIAEHIAADEIATRIRARNTA